MDYPTLISEIERRAPFDSRDHAERAATATLSVLAERIAGGEPKDLAAQLPEPLAGALQAEGQRETFGFDEFCQRVADREGKGCSREDAERHARAVLSTIAEAVSPGEIDDVAGQLPAEWRGRLLP